MWDIHLNQNDTTAVWFEVTSGNGDLGMSLFSPITTSPYAATRSNAFLEMDQMGAGGNEGEQFVATETGWWSVVVWSKDGIETSYNLNVCIGSLPAPTLMDPVDGDNCVTDNTPDFDWSDVPSAASYGILVDNDSDFSSPEIDGEVTGSTYTPSTSLPDETYYWKVRSKDNLGNWGGWSSVWSFGIDTQNPTADLALGIGETITIQWNADDPSMADSPPGDRAGTGSGRILRMNRNEASGRPAAGRGPAGAKLSGSGGENKEGNVESVDILLSRDDGSSWDVIFTDLENDGNEDWEVAGPESDSCKIKVTATDSCGNEGDDISGRFSIGAVGISDGEFSSGVIPKSFSLSQNYPNPFNPRTVIRYDVPNVERDVAVELIIFDARGKLVRNLVNELKGPGRYEVYWDEYDDAGTAISSGVYFYMMKTDGFVNIRKMIQLK